MRWFAVFRRPAPSPVCPAGPTLGRRCGLRGDGPHTAPPDPPRRPCSLWLAAVLGLLLANRAEAVELESHRWGWDGRVVVDHFNLLTLQLRNDDETAFEGALEVFPGGPLGPTGFPVVFPELFIAPFATRTVQLSPFIGDTGEYTVRILDRYGDPVARFSLPAPSTGPPAVVQFSSATGVRGGVGLPTFTAELFPSNFAPVHGTLRLVVLDFAPRWTAAQRRAFWDWLHSGGTLHLYRGHDGRLPDFPAELAALSGQARFTRIGAGWVARHDKTLAEARDVWQQARRSPPWTRSFETPDRPLKRQDRERIDSYVFRNLRGRTIPKINWDAVIVVLIIYTALVFPGVRLLLRGLDYRLSLAAIVLLSLAATFGIYFIGRRGYGETAAVNSVVIARQTRPGEYLAEARTSVFVTASGRYTIRGTASEAAYGPSDERGSLFGRTVIFAGVRPAIQTTIPLFSSFTFRHAYRTTEGPRWRLRVEVPSRPPVAGLLPGQTMLFHLEGPPVRPAWIACAINNQYTMCTATPRQNVFRSAGTIAHMDAPLPAHVRSQRTWGRTRNRGPLDVPSLMKLDYAEVLWPKFLEPPIDASSNRQLPLCLYFACELDQQSWKNAFLLEDAGFGRQRVTVLFRVAPEEITFAEPDRSGQSAPQ